MTNPRWDTAGQVPGSRDVMKEVINNQDSTQESEVTEGETWYDSTAEKLKVGLGDPVGVKQVLTEDDLVQSNSVPLSVAPGSPVTDTIYWADGVNWDPLDYSAFGQSDKQPYAAMWTGTIWVPYVSSSASRFQSGRNLLLNAQFRIFQRDATGQFSNPLNNAYTMDRWQVSQGGSAAFTSISSIDSQASTIVSPTQINRFIRMIFSQDATQSSSIRLNQHLRGDFSLLSGEWITVQFWAKSATQSRVAIHWYWDGSTPLSGEIVRTDALDASTWRFFTARFQVPNLEGQTISASTKFTFAIMNMCSASDVGGAMNDNGGTIDIANIQAEVGYHPTVFDRLPLSVDLQECYRYYQLVGDGATGTCLEKTAVLYPRFYLSIPLKAPTAFGSATLFPLPGGTTSYSFDAYFGGLQAARTISAASFTTVTEGEGAITCIVGSNGGSPGADTDVVPIGAGVVSAEADWLIVDSEINRDA